MRTPIVRMTILERVIICVIFLIIISAQLWTFAIIADLFIAAAFLVILGLAAKRKIVLIGCALLTATCLIAATMKALDVRPLPTKIVGANFQNVSLPEVLQYLAKQKTNTQLGISVCLTKASQTNALRLT